MGIFDFLKKNHSSSPEKANISVSIQSNMPVQKKSNAVLHEEYATALLLWAYGTGKPIPDKYPLYYQYECSITNPKLLHKRLIKDGLLGPAAYSDILTNYKIPELKEILVSMGLSTTGKKQDLIMRIVDNADTSTLDHFLDVKSLYSTTELGTLFLSNHQDYILLHKHYSHWNISIEEYDSAKQKYPYNDFYEIARSIFTDRLSSAKSASTLYICFLCLAQLFNEIKLYRESLYYYFLVLYVNLNSLDCYPPYSLYKDGIITKKALKEAYPVSLFSPGIITAIVDLKDYWDNSLIDTIYAQRVVSDLFCDKKLFIQIISDIYNEVSFPADKWNQRLGKIFYKYFGI